MHVYGLPTYIHIFIHAYTNMYLYIQAGSCMAAYKHAYRFMLSAYVHTKTHVYIPQINSHIYTDSCMAWHDMTIDDDDDDNDDDNDDDDDDDDDLFLL